MLRNFHLVVGSNNESEFSPNTVVVVLQELHLFNLLSQGGTVALSEKLVNHGWICVRLAVAYRAVLASDANLACTFCLRSGSVRTEE